MENLSQMFGHVRVTSLFELLEKMGQKAKFNKSLCVSLSLFVCLRAVSVRDTRREKEWV